MSRTIHCVKLNKEAPGLDYLPYPGALGERIYNEISAEAWMNWQKHQTMLINEYRLNMLDSSAQEFLEKEMQNYFFGDGSAVPQGFTPPT